ncbi:speckle-type POZ protein-like [Temnothorax curvispinosus]|uniref:Speckle-type POZ protein-like n=1 Tax=Temnothorax curvispinosus TaxID=300111 RepID=A0A6J1QA84_9HYME|nr:speckle-type POZ protein-like [Temnothorax curvispinosus]
MESTIIDHTWKINQFLRFHEIKNAITFSSFPEIDKCEILMNVSRQPDTSYVIKFYILTSNSFDGSCNTSIMLEPETVISVNFISGHMSNMTLLSEISTDKFASLSRTDTLTIRCEFEIFHNLINKTVRLRLLQSSTNVSKVTKCREDSTFDESRNEELIKFIIGEKQYVISKKSLRATHSNYFINICRTHEGKEKNLTINMNELVADNEVESFRQILLFILTGSIDHGDYDMLKKLLTTAHKYDVSALKLMCENYLLRYITIENAVELIQLAFSSKAKFLKIHSISFIKFHIKEIMDTKEFQNLPQEDLNEIMVMIEKNKSLEIDIHQFFSSPPMADKTFSFANI